MRWTPDELWVDSRHRTRDFIFSGTSSPALGLTQPFIRTNILGFSLGVIMRKLRMCSATNPFLHMQIWYALGKFYFCFNIESITILRETVQRVTSANEISRKSVNHAVQQRVLNNSVLNHVRWQRHGVKWVPAFL